MQPKVQSDDEREPEHSSSSSQSSLGSAHGSLWLRWLRPITAFGAGPSPGHRAQLRPGLLLKMFFWADARPPIKMGAFLCLREWKKKSPNPVDKHVGLRVRMRR